MYFEEALVVELGSISGLSNKVFPITAIEGTVAPYVVYVSSEGVAEKDLEGYDLLREIDCEIHIVSNSYAEMKSLTRSVISTIQSFQGRVIGGTDGVMIYDVTLDNPHEQWNNDLFQYICILPITVKI
jgi:hypothetical protein